MISRPWCAARRRRNLEGDFDRMFTAPDELWRNGELPQRFTWAC
ncbi:hypothetical protein [Streptomyces sp. YIM B13518]